MTLVQLTFYDVNDRLPEPDVPVLTAPYSMMPVRHIKTNGEWFFDAYPVERWAYLPPVLFGDAVVPNQFDTKKHD